jgi:DNA (cytosine-5)-methyltransferase 1
VTRPRLLDLFCGAGGAAMGYHRAGFDVVGVDIAPQPRYPFEFVRADALGLLDDLLAGGTPRGFGYALADFAAIHASPTCQSKARVTDWRGSRSSHPDNLTPTLAKLTGAPVPWVVENVPEALDRWDLLLCGSQFGLTVRRHRGFRAPWLPGLLLPPCQHHRGLLPFEHKGERAYADAMDCRWMTKFEARQAIPPAYTELIGGLLATHMREAAA